MKLDRTIYDRAREARDPHFDGFFFIGVHSTGIFCRPICPATVSRAMQLIRQGALNDVSLEAFAQKLGVGASPKALVTTQRVLFAKKLLSETDPPVSQIAFAAGFGSIRRFNAAFQKVVRQPPSAFRRPPKGKQTGDGSMSLCRLTLPFRPPTWASSGRLAGAANAPHPNRSRRGPKAGAPGGPTPPSICGIPECCGTPEGGDPCTTTISTPA